MKKGNHLSEKLVSAQFFSFGKSSGSGRREGLGKQFNI